MGNSCLHSFCARTSRELSKLKTLLGLTVSRLAILRNQRQARCAQAEADVAHLLLLGHQDRALLRAEMVIKERNMLDVLAMVESYCHLITERAFLLHNQKECPDELREAAAGLAFAASRCGDLPELREVRRIFSTRFGKEFITAAAELRNNCGVSGKMVQKFSTRQPSLEMRAKVTKEIAIEKGIKVKLAEPMPETAEVNQNPNLQRKNLAKTTVEPPSTACDLHELAIMAQEKYKDAGSAAQAAFESAAYAAAAAKTAVELYRSESEGRDSGNPDKPKYNSHMDNCLPSASCCGSIDLGCRVSKVSSLRIDMEKPRGKEILSEIDESDNDEELIRLATKVLVPVNKAHSFAGPRGNDLRTKSQVDSNLILSSQKRSQDGDREDDYEEVNEMAIIAVEPLKKSKPGRYGSEKGVEAKNVQLSPGDNLAARHSLSRASSFSVRTRW